MSCLGMKYDRYVMKYDTDTFDIVANIVQGKSPIIKEVLCRCLVITLTVPKNKAYIPKACHLA
jgi:hypothetical protein